MTNPVQTLTKSVTVNDNPFMKPVEWLSLLLLAGVILVVLPLVLIVLFGTGAAAWAAARLPFANNWVKLRRSMSLAVKSLWLHKLRSFLYGLFAMGWLIRLMRGKR